MEKFKNAFKSINKFGLLALIMVAFATLAFTPSKRQDVTWRQTSPTTWTEVLDDNYFCDGASQICTRTYPENHNPNQNPLGYTGEESGTFTPIQ